MRPALICVLGLLVLPGHVLAQHEYPATDVQNGGRLFMASCAACHGPDGNEIPNVDLASGQFRRASTDEDLVRIIRSGIPDTAMPPNNMSEVNAGNVVAYLRSLAAEPRAATTGDPGRGKAIFEGKGNCTSCHRVGGVGSRTGPDLTNVGRQRRVVELERSILDPGVSVLPSHRSFRVVTRDGAATTGRLLNHDLFTVQLLDSKERLVSFQKSNLREYGFVDGTPMPSYRDTLSADEVADLVGYLASLRGRVNP